MQEEKIIEFKKALGLVIKEIRETKTGISINQLSNEFDFDKGNMSKIERGIFDIQFSTGWKISQALGIKFSDFAKILEEKLGEDFSLLDDE